MKLKIKQNNEDIRCNFGFIAAGIDSRVAKVLSDVQLVAPYDRIVKSFSGGQQARLLLAAGKHRFSFLSLLGLIISMRYVPLFDVALISPVFFTLHLTAFFSFLS